MNNLNTGQGPGWPPPEPPPLNGSFVAAMVVIAILVPLLGPAAAVAVGAMNLHRRGAKTILWTGGVVLAVSLVVIMMIPAFLVAAPSFQQVRSKAHEAETKINLHAVQMAIEYYGIEHDGVYPVRLDSIEELHFLPERDPRIEIPPRNPVTGELMHAVAFGTRPCAGEFTYIPVEADGQVKGYYLFAYGYESTPGEDVDGDGEPDHVIIVLYSAGLDSTADDNLPVTSDGSPLPPLEELLRAPPVSE